MPKVARALATTKNKKWDVSKIIIRAMDVDDDDELSSCCLHGFNLTRFNLAGTFLI